MSQKPALLRWDGNILYLGDLYVGEIERRTPLSSPEGRPWRIWWNGRDEQWLDGECTGYHPSESEGRAALENKIQELVI